MLHYFPWRILLVKLFIRLKAVGITDVVFVNKYLVVKLHDQLIVPVINKYLVVKLHDQLIVSVINRYLDVKLHD